MSALDKAKAIAWYGGQLIGDSVSRALNDGLDRIEAWHRKEARKRIEAGCAGLGWESVVNGKGRHYPAVPRSRQDIDE